VVRVTAFVVSSISSLLTFVVYQSFLFTSTSTDDARKNQCPLLSATINSSRKTVSVSLRRYTATVLMAARHLFLVRCPRKVFQEFLYSEAYYKNLAHRSNSQNFDYSLAKNNIFFYHCVSLQCLSNFLDSQNSKIAIDFTIVWQCIVADSLWITTDELNSSFIGITLLHVSGSPSAHHQEFLPVHWLWYTLCSCDRCYQEYDVPSYSW
jgi:hypothetical protein